MKTSFRILSIILLLCLVVGSFASCNKDNGGEDGPVHVDYVEQTKLDMNSSTKKLEVTMKSHIDGDTTHFHVPTSVDVTGVMKARYLAKLRSRRRIQ